MVTIDGGAVVHATDQEFGKDPNDLAEEELLFLGPGCRAAREA